MPSPPAPVSMPDKPAIVIPSVEQDKARAGAMMMMDHMLGEPDSDEEEPAVLPEASARPDQW